uniref:ARAD1D48884p n=1 Tax=Blastobotrys adeninivorans TaxID=409370 RepID=A0A060TDM5_BLAAD
MVSLRGIIVSAPVKTRTQVVFDMDTRVKRARVVLRKAHFDNPDDIYAIYGGVIVIDELEVRRKNRPGEIHVSKKLIMYPNGANEVTSFLYQQRIDGPILQSNYRKPSNANTRVKDDLKGLFCLGPKIRSKSLPYSLEVQLDRVDAVDMRELYQVSGYIESVEALTSEPTTKKKLVLYEDSSKLQLYLYDELARMKLKPGQRIQVSGVKLKRFNDNQITGLVRARYGTITHVEPSIPVLPPDFSQGLDFSDDGD